MTTSRVCVAALLVINVLGLAAATAQQQEPIDRADVTKEMAGIRESLDRVAALLETHLRHQRIELVIRRIELKERRLDPLERRVSSAQNDVRGLEKEITQLKSMVEEQHEQVSREIREGVDKPDSETRRMIAEIERVLRAQEASLDEARRRLQELEDDLADQREEIEVLDEMLLEMLE